MVQRNEILMMQLDFSDTPWPAYEEHYGVALIEPAERISVIEHIPRITAGSGAFMAGGNTAAHAWRTLAAALGLGAVDLEAACGCAGTNATDDVLAAQWGATERNDQ